MTREVYAQKADLPRCRPPGSTAQPAIHLGLDLGAGYEFTGSLGQAKGFGSDQGVAGDASQRPARHLLLGAVGKVTATILGQRPIPLTSQHTRILKESVEHGETSVDLRRQPPVPTRINRLCWRSGEK
jgi:hypothetical protein